MSEAPKALEYPLRAIYNRIAPQIKIDGLNAKVNIAANDFGFGYVTGIEIESADGYERAELCLDNDYDEERADIKNYLWSYYDLIQGWGIESELGYSASDEEVAAFFKKTHLDHMKHLQNARISNIEQ